MIVWCRWQYLKFARLLSGVGKQVYYFSTDNAENSKFKIEKQSDEIRKIFKQKETANQKFKQFAKQPDKQIVWESSLLQDCVRQSQFQEEVFINLIRDVNYRKKLNCKAVTWSLNKLKFLKDRQIAIELLELLSNEFAIKKYALDHHAIRALGITTERFRYLLSYKSLDVIMDKIFDSLGHKFDDPISLLVLIRFVRIQKFEQQKIFWQFSVPVLNNLMYGMSGKQLAECVTEMLHAKDFIGEDVFRQLGERALSLALSEQVSGNDLARILAVVSQSLQASQQLPDVKLINSLQNQLKNLINQVDEKTACWAVVHGIQDRKAHV
eukprot:TRINITY_DN50188_c0_g1_i2.p1 TRINITY_DN50188_c0_g1~~TRINITY_DN50188_c0_g1_i2.p1  ORF type:complete len:331 (+),score=39.76 TRINITY_DN50188_c0_g1_i2:23-994(+)